MDIGSLQACVLCGYPGTIAATWQEAGRAGRRKDTSLTVLVASSASLDQYIVAHPQYFFSQSPENALLNPDNLYVLLNHFKCSAYELPFKQNETFGSAPGYDEMLGFLEESDILRRVDDTWFWQAEEFPASEISLRTAMAENFLINDITDPTHVRVIGEMDRFTVPMLLHENAIYMHEGLQYQVEKLDFNACKAFVRRIEVDYYTDADLNVSLSLLDITEQCGSAAWGDISVTAITKLFKKMKLDTGENLGYGPVRLPESEMHTNAVWWTLDPAVAARYDKDSLQGGMLGIANLLRIVSPLYLMCSPRDISVSYQVKCPFTEKSTIILYDTCPGGIGLAEKAYKMREVLLAHCKTVVLGCDCEDGCPGCTGPVAEIGPAGKKIALQLLEHMLTTSEVC